MTISFSACPLNPAPELQSEQEFSQRFAHIIRGVIDFAGMIPGFQLLTQDDKFTLLKAGLFDALFVRLICMFDSSINSIICLNGQVMRRDAIQNGANARFLVDSTFNFAERMNSMNLSDAEIGLFCAIVLITPDRPGLRNIELIEKMYSRLKGCLQTIIQQNRPDQPDFMGKLLETMPDLRTLSTLHTEKLVVFRTEHKEMLRQQMWTIDDVEPRSSSKSPVNNASTAGGWLQQERIDMLPSNKSPVSSTDCGNDTTTTTTTNFVSSQHMQQEQQHQQQPSSLASSAPLLAATLSGNTGSTCPLRQRANSGSSGDSGAADLDLIVGSHAHLTQNGLTITPIVRASVPQQQQQQQQHQNQQQQQQLHHHLAATAAVNRYRKLDSPTDSGIESGNEKNECVGVSKPVSSGGSSSCSSPRSSVDDALDCTEGGTSTNAATSSSSSTTATTSTTPPSSLKRQMVDDMPVLKRVLQAPPLYDTNSLMDEAYKPHKKFRALRHREYETAEADASCSTSTTNTNSSVNSGTQIVSMPNTSSSSTAQQTSAVSSPQQQSSMVGSQLHMHLTRTPTALQTTLSSSSSTSSACSSLSSTHSVLAKSLLAEPRMTPEQMKRSDIIQNYIMRDSAPSSSTTPNGPGSRSPAPPPPVGSPQPLHAHLQNQRDISMRHVSTPTNSNLGSPPPPPPPVTPSRGGWVTGNIVTGGGNAAAASVITTTSTRQQSLSPGISHHQQQQQHHHHHHQYFQSPHSTSTSSSASSTSSSSSPPHHLLELQVEIADSQQPLNLSKKSPTPPPSKLQALVAAATVVQQQQQQQQHRYPTVVSADANTTKNSTPSNGSSSTTTNTVLQQHKVLLEA